MAAHHCARTFAVVYGLDFPILEPVGATHCPRISRGLRRPYNYLTYTSSTIHRLIFRRAGDFIRPEDDLFLAGQLFFHLVKNQVEVT